MTEFRTYLLVASTLLAAAPALAAPKVTQADLVSDGGVSATVIDPNLVNPWGMSNGPGGNFWISDNATGLTTLYDGNGVVNSLVVTVPGAPTGQVFNATKEFGVSENGVSGTPPFLFASENGTISAWAPSVDFPKAIVAIDKSAQKAVYKGIAIVSADNGSTLMATNFHSGYVEMYDGAYHSLGQFRDQGSATVAPLPRNYAPYNVQVLAGHIFVTYAKQDAVRHDGVGAAGAGYVDEVTSTGKLVRRIASRGALNAPWGLAVAPSSFGRMAGALLVGNFGDGTISAYRIATGSFLGQLHTPTGAAVQIDGLWALSDANGALNADPAKLYFTAGPAGETHGLFGSLSASP